MDDVERGPQAEALESDLRSFFTEAASQNLSVLTDGSTKKGGPPVEVLIKRITSDPEAVRKALEEYAAFFAEPGEQNQQYGELAKKAKALQYMVI